MEHDEWLQLRKQGLGASEAPAALGICPYRSRLELWHSKVHPELVEQLDENENEYLYWGSRQEPIIRQRVIELYSCQVEYRPHWLCRHASKPWLLATPDGIVALNQAIVDAAGQAGIDMSALSLGDPGNLEIKTADHWVSAKWEEGPPENYECQMRHAMAVLALGWSMCAVLIGGNRCRQYILLRDFETERLIYEDESDFWSLVQQRIEPEVDGSEKTSRFIKRLYPEDTGATVQLGDEAFASDQLREDAIKHAKECEEGRAEAENWLKQRIKDATYGLLPDGTIYQWKVEPRRAQCCAKCGAEVRPPSRPRVLRRKAAKPSKRGSTTA
jgi:putative phage-type endonuclease